MAAIPTERASFSDIVRCCDDFLDTQISQERECHDWHGNCLRFPLKQPKAITQDLPTRGIQIYQTIFENLGETRRLQNPDKKKAKRANRENQRAKTEALIELYC